MLARVPRAMLDFLHKRYLCHNVAEPDHEVTRYLRLMQWLGCGGDDTALEFPFAAPDHAALGAMEPLPAVRALRRHPCQHAHAFAALACRADRKSS